MALFANYLTKVDKRQESEQRPSPPPAVPAPPTTAEPKLEELQIDGVHAPLPAFKRVRAQVQQFLVKEVKSADKIESPAHLRQL
ncbi:MAG: hypothetical protein KDE47_16020, partial [Caldilineaceae bacterium]|nr:hypothetical protein [Caldilineaceae bacterium]